MPNARQIFLRLSWLSGAASLLWCDATAGVAVAAIRAAVRQIVRGARQFINQAAAVEDESRQFLGHTMASHQTQGIQQLLAAEKKAAEKVAEARKRKVRRIKQARDEAQAEVELYRQEREKLFRAYEAKHMGSREDVAARIDRDTETHLKILEKNVTDHKDAVIDELIEFACDVVPEAHPNYFVLRKFNRI